MAFFTRSEIDALNMGLRVEHERERAELKQSMAAFVKAAWRFYLPREDLIWGWHLDCIIAHLEAVARGEIRQLLINIAPRHNKSGLVSVMFPAWMWARDPGFKMATGSYALSLAKRDNNNSRQIIKSSWYRRMFPDVEIAKDLEARTMLTQGGDRFVFSTRGTITGEGGSCAIWDDPHMAQDMWSPVQLQRTKEFYTTTLPTRLNDPNRATTIVVMQRLGPQDLSGHILQEALESTSNDLVHVCLPVHYDPKRHMRTRWFEDPRKTAGELLWPARMNDEAVDRITRKMTPEAAAAQMEQLTGGGTTNLLSRDRWQIWTKRRLPPFHKIVVSFDPALKDTRKAGQTSALGSRWACSVWGLFPWPDRNGKEFWHAMLIDAWADHMSYHEAKKGLLASIEKWTVDGEPPDRVIIEDKAAGPILLAELQLAGIQNLMAYNPKALGPGRNDKVMRAGLVSGVFWSKRVWCVGAPIRGEDRRSLKTLTKYSELVVSECDAFPGGDYDDLVDTVTQATQMLRSSYYLASDLDVDPETVHEDERDEEALPSELTPMKESVYG